MLPTRAFCEMRHVLHDKGSRHLSSHHVHELVNVLAAGIVRVHSPYPGPSLARRSANHYVHRLGWKLRVLQHTFDDVIAQIRPIGGARMLVSLVGPEQIETSVCKSEVETSGTRVQRQHRRAFAPHGHALFLKAGTFRKPRGETVSADPGMIA